MLADGRHFRAGPLAVVTRRAAHLGVYVTIQQGQHKDWQVNDAADELAKVARPHLGGTPEAWLASGRRRRATLSERRDKLRRPEILRAHLVAPHLGRATRLRARRLAVVGPRLFFLQGSWVCSILGSDFAPD